MFVGWQTLGADAPPGTERFHVAVAVHVRIAHTPKRPRRRIRPLDADVLQRLPVVFRKLVPKRVKDIYIKVTAWTTPFLCLF